MRAVQEADVQKAGELVRDEELSRFTKIHPKRKGKCTPNKVSNYESGPSTNEQDLLPMDRLCVALDNRLEKENTSQATNNIPDKQEHPPYHQLHHYLIDW